MERFRTDCFAFTSAVKHSDRWMFTLHSLSKWDSEFKLSPLLLLRIVMIRNQKMTRNINEYKDDNINNGSSLRMCFTIRAFAQCCKLRTYMDRNRKSMPKHWTLSRQRFLHEWKCRFFQTGYLVCQSTVVIYEAIPLVL